MIQCKNKFSDLTAEFAELETQGAEVMDEDALRQMTVQGDPIQAAQSEKVDPSQMYSGISMADDRINQLKVRMLIYCYQFTRRLRSFWFIE